MDLALLTFSLYILFVVIGAMLYLIALGPTLNIPSSFRGTTHEVKSLLFFYNIGNLNSKAWEEYWDSRQPAELQSLMAKDYLRESKFIAEKARAKFEWMSFGSASFKLALLCLLGLVADLLSSNPVIVYFAFFFGGSVWWALLAVERLIRPPRDSRVWALWAGFAGICLLISVLILFRVL
jgi:hypothetical protein